jgi:hypothetical protein
MFINNYAGEPVTVGFMMFAVIISTLVGTVPPPPPAWFSSYWKKGIILFSRNWDFKAKLEALMNSTDLSLTGILIRDYILENGGGGEVAQRRRGGSMVAHLTANH